MTNIRKYAKSVGFEIKGKLKRVDDIDRNTRFYIDEAENEYIVNVINGTICIITNDGGVI